MFTTYAGLKTTVADWLNKKASADVAANADVFIHLFESKFDKVDLKHPLSSANGTVSLSAGRIALPADFKELRRFTVAGQALPAAYVTPEQLWDKEDSQDTSRQWYSIDGSDLLVYPYSATEPATGTLIYWSKLTKLSDVATTNWLLAESPELYLHGSLVEAAPYLRDPEALQMWKSKVEEATSLLLDAARRRAEPAGPLRPSTPRLGR